LLLLFTFCNGACLTKDGKSLAKIIPETDTRFNGLTSLGLGYDERTRQIRDEVYTYDKLDFTESKFEERDCTFVGSFESSNENENLDLGFGINGGDLFKFNTSFGFNNTNLETIYTGYYACAFFRQSATVAINRHATVGEDLLRRAEANEFTTEGDVTNRYGTQYIDQLQFGALYTTTVRFTTTNKTLIDEWHSGLNLDVPIQEGINLTVDFSTEKTGTFKRTNTRVEFQESARGFDLADNGSSDFVSLLNQPDEIISRIAENTKRFEATGITFPDELRFGEGRSLEDVDRTLANSEVVPITFSLDDFGSIAELPINNLKESECADLDRHLQEAAEFRDQLLDYSELLDIAASDLLDSYGIDRGSLQGVAYSFALQLIDEDITDILLNIADYERLSVQDIVATPISRYSCGLGLATIGEIERRVRDVTGASNDNLADEVFTGTTCRFDGVVSDDNMRSLRDILIISGCPADGSAGRVDVAKLREEIQKDLDNRDLVLIGGNVDLVGTDFEVRGVRFDEDREAVGLGYIRRNIRDEIVSIDTSCTLISEDDFVSTPLGNGQVVDFSCVTHPSCLVNGRVDSREIRRELASGELEVQLIANGERHFFDAQQVEPIDIVPSEGPRPQVTVREIPCTVNDRCGDGEGSCYRDAECQANLMCHAGTRKHPKYEYENDALSFCVPFEQKIARGINQCSPTALCDDGEGSCATNADCQGSLQCRDARNNPAYNLGVNQIFQKICVRALTPFDPAECECCGANSGCDFPLKEGDGHCEHDGQCASGLTCVPNSCHLYRGINNKRNEFSEADSCCMDMRGWQVIDQDGFSNIRHIQIDESNTDRRTQLCAAECAKDINCVLWTAATDGNDCWLSAGYDFDNSKLIFRNNRRSFPKFAFGETPYGCPRGYVRTNEESSHNLVLYGGNLRCMKKPADKICGYGMKYSIKALQGDFEISSVERDISVCRQKCKGCGAFRYNTDTSECAISHGLEFLLSDHESNFDEIVCVYDAEQAGERRVATNVCLNPRGVATTFPLAISGKILSVKLEHRSGQLECLERSLSECPSHHTGGKGVFGTPDYCDCCLHGSSCNRCPRGFFHSGIFTACSGRGEFRCHGLGEVHSEHSANFACDPSEHAQIVLKTSTHTIEFDSLNTQADRGVLTSSFEDLGYASSIISVQYTDKRIRTSSNIVFAEGEVCFDVFMTIDDSQVSEVSGQDAACYCDTPAIGTSGLNRLSCTNNEHHFCASGEECFAPSGVAFSERASACREPLIAKQEVQHHSTECTSNGDVGLLQEHAVICPDGYALTAWEVNTCTSGRAATQLVGFHRCVEHIWTDKKAKTAGECAELLRDDPRCKDKRIIQRARNTQTCGCFSGSGSNDRHCRFESGQFSEDTADVFEVFGFQIDYECIPIQEQGRELKETECVTILAIGSECGGNNDGCGGNLGLGDGDCDTDNDCAGSLVCGKDNCGDFRDHAGWREDSFTSWDTTDDCCMDPGATRSGTWEHTANAAISGYNIEHLDDVTVDDCKQRCSAAPWCKSFDYYKFKAKCDLSDKSADEITQGLKTNYDGNPFDHYALTRGSDLGSIPMQCDANQALKEFRFGQFGCGENKMKAEYICSNLDEPGNPYSVALNYFPALDGQLSAGSTRCGSGDLLTGWRYEAQCVQRNEGYLPLEGQNAVACQWEGAVNGEAPSAGGNSVNCGRICDSREDCNSFTMCGETCYFTADNFNGDFLSRTRLCTDDRGECRSFRNVNFVLPN